MDQVISFREKPACIQGKYLQSGIFLEHHMSKDLVLKTKTGAEQTTHG